MDARHYDGSQFIPWREEKNLTQDDMAQILGVSRETISRIETGKNASYEILCEYTAYFDKPITDILYSRPQTIAA